MENTKQYLAQHPYFRALSAVQLEEVARSVTSRSLARHEILAIEGEACEAVYLVVQGRVRALKMSAQGREQVISELGPGQAFYIVPALDGGPLPATTEASTRVSLLSFPRRDFVAILNRYPSVAMQVLMDFAKRLRNLSSLVEDLALRSVSARLARALLERASAPESHRTTQREMAAQLGTVREVVARTLAHFERQGWIRLRRGVIELIDPQALEQVASDQEL